MSDTNSVGDEGGLESKANNTGVGQKRMRNSDVMGGCSDANGETEVDDANAVEVEVDGQRRAQRELEERARTALILDR